MTIDMMRDVWQNPVTGQWDYDSPRMTTDHEYTESIVAAIMELDAGHVHNARRILKEISGYQEGW